MSKEKEMAEELLVQLSTGTIINEHYLLRR